MIGRAIGSGFAAARDFIARGLLRVGVTPNALTVVGALLTAGAAVCYALGSGGRFAWTFRTDAGPSAWLLLAGGLLVLSSACDMLDGAVARIGDKKTTFGAFLDSSIDRFSDFAVYAGIAIWFAWSGPRANITFTLMAMIAFFNGYMVSYTKARAEDLIDSVKVGFWQRGERSAALLIATFSHNIPALVVQQAILPMFTVYRRMSYTYGEIRRKETGRGPRQRPLLDKLRIWRRPRMSWGYDITVAINIAWLIFAPVEPVDVLRQWFGG